MSFTEDTYLRAKAAIEAGDAASVVRLLKRPIAIHGPKKPVGWLFDLTRAAARRGVAPAVEHLITLAPLSYAVGLRGAAWAHAEEQGHHALAQAIRPMAEGDRADAFALAVTERTWNTALGLIQQGHRPAAITTAQVLELMSQDKSALDHPTLLHALLPLANANGLVMGALVALKMKDEAAVAHCVAKASRVEMRKKSDDLRMAAYGAGRYDWFVQVTAGVGNPLPDSFLRVILQRGTGASHLCFFEAAVEDRPKVVQLIRDDSSAQAETVRGLLLTVAQRDDLGLEDATFCKVFPMICRPHEARRFRASFSDGNPLVQGSLNALALQASEELRQEWFQAEPHTFARAIAVMRDRDARAKVSHDRDADSTGSLPVRRPRART